MKSVFSLFIACVLSLAAFAQESETVVADANAQERRVESFTSVYVKGGIVAYIAQGTSSAVAVSAAENVDVKRIVTEVRNGTLYISFNSDGLQGWKGNKKLKAYVTVAQLRSLSANGGSIVKSVESLRAAETTVEAQGGSIVELKISGANVKLNVQGGSIMSLEGEVAMLEGNVTGGSILKAAEYKATDADVNVQGGSIVNFEVSRKLKLFASGGSVVNVDGNPSDRTINKSGGSVVSIVAAKS